MSTIGSAVKRVLSRFYRHQSSDARDVFIHSTQRSGSTLLFDILSSEPRAKAVGEPFQERKQSTLARYTASVRSRYGSLDPRTASELEAYLIDLLSGRFVGGFSRTYNPRSVRHHVFTDHNVVKILRALELAGWFAERFNAAFHLMLLRHPAPATASRTRNGWHAPLEEYLHDSEWCEARSEAQLAFLRARESGDLWERHLGVWLCEHAFLANRLREGYFRSVPVLCYEHIVHSPADAITWLEIAGLIADRGRAESVMSRPSRSSRHSSGRSRTAIVDQDRTTMLEAWQTGMSRNRIETIERGLSTFKLGFYSPDQVLPIGDLEKPIWDRPNVIDRITTA